MSRQIMNAPRTQAHIMRPGEYGAPDEVFVEFSKWPDGTVEIEDFASTDETIKPHWVRYVRADTKEASGE